MAKTDLPATLGNDLKLALALLTRLPAPQADFETARPAAHAAWAYPLAGALVGALAGGVGWLAQGLGLPPLAVGLLVVSALVVSTGAMHEDGLADTCDGLWGGWTPERRLEIMRDSHIGSYGVVGLILSLGLRAVGYGAIFADLGPVAVIAVAMVSRAAMVGVMSALPHARANGLARGTGRVPAAMAGMAVLFALIAGFAVFGSPGLVIAAVAGLGAAGVGLVARAKIGGQTGDILGASQQVAEICALMAVVALA